MPTSTSTMANEQLAPQQIYDLIMWEIEPELTSDVIPTLEAKYANETSEEKSIRMERYTFAFEAFDEALSLFQTSQQMHIAAVREILDAYAKNVQAIDDEETIKKLDSDMNQ